MAVVLAKVPITFVPYTFQSRGALSIKTGRPGNGRGRNPNAAIGRPRAPQPLNPGRGNAVRRMRQYP